MAECGAGSRADRLSDQCFVATFAAEHNLTFIHQFAHNLENLLLLGFDFRQADRALGFQIFLECFRGTAGHVLEN